MMPFKKHFPLVVFAQHFKNGSVDYKKWHSWEGTVDPNWPPIGWKQFQGRGQQSDCFSLGKSKSVE